MIDTGTLEEKLYLALWGALAGGLVSLLVNTVFAIMVPRSRRRRLTKSIRIEADPPHNGYVRFRVHNTGFWTINDVTLYLSIYASQDDVLEPEDWHRAHITKSRYVPLNGDQLCWSVRSPRPSPMRVPIFSGEAQPFALCLIGPDEITIPSEEGWGRAAEKTTARAFLRRQRYAGTLRVVSSDTLARLFKVTIDPDNPGCPATIEDLQPPLGHD